MAIDTSWKGNKNTILGMISLLPMYLTYIFIKDYYTPYMIKNQPVLYFILIYILIAGAIGYFSTRLYKKKISTDSKILKIIVYLNIVAWVIPILGVFIATTSFGLREKFTQKNKHLIITSIGLIFSIINFMLGAFKI